MTAILLLGGAVGTALRPLAVLGASLAALVLDRLI